MADHSRTPASIEEFTSSLGNVNRREAPIVPKKLNFPLMDLAGNVRTHESSNVPSRSEMKHTKPEAEFISRTLEKYTSVHQRSTDETNAAPDGPSTYSSDQNRSWSSSTLPLPKRRSNKPNIFNYLSRKQSFGDHKAGDNLSGSISDGEEVYKWTPPLRTRCSSSSDTSGKGQQHWVSRTVSQSLTHLTDDGVELGFSPRSKTLKNAPFASSSSELSDSQVSSHETSARHAAQAQYSEHLTKTKSKVTKRSTSVKELREILSRQVEEEKRCKSKPAPEQIPGAVRLWPPTSLPDDHLRKLNPVRGKPTLFTSIHPSNPYAEMRPCGVY